MLATARLELRRGRKRKTGHIYPGSIDADPRMRDVALSHPHRRRWGLDQRAETPLGGLNLVGALTDEQYAAGCQYAKDVAKYRAALGLPKSTPSGVDLNRVGGMDRGVETLDPDEIAHRKEAYDRAFAAVLEAGHRAARAVAQVAVYGNACPEGCFQDLKRGLDKLAAHYRLVKAERKAKILAWRP